MAFEHEESAVGLVCVAAPVLDLSDDVVAAAISVTGPVTRFNPQAHADRGARRSCRRRSDAGPAGRAAPTTADSIAFR